MMMMMIVERQNKYNNLKQNNIRIQEKTEESNMQISVLQRICLVKRKIESILLLLHLIESLDV